MKGVAGKFMVMAVVYGLIGFVLGVYMGAKNSFGMMSVHSHLNLLGWASFAIFAFYYNAVPAAGEGALAKAHFWLANIGIVVMSGSLALMVMGNAGAVAGAGIGSVVSLIAYIVFAVVVFRNCCQRATA